MNKAKRKELERALYFSEQAGQIIESVASDEQYCYDNYPENLQESDAGIKMEDAISALEDAADMLNDVNDLIMTAMA